MAPQRDFTALVAAPFHQLIPLVALAVLIAVLLGLVAAAAISRPLGQLNAATRRLAAGDFDQPLPPAPIRELRELGESFGKMTERLRAAFFELHDLNQTLRTAERELALSNQDLELRVAERTSALVAAQARVQANERRTRRMLDDMPTAISAWTLEPESRVTYVNEQFVRTFGYRLEDIPRMRDWALRAYPDEAYRKASMDWWDAAVATAIPRGGQVESREFRVTCKDGSVRNIVISATALDEVLVASFLDITERERSGTALRKSEERYRPPAGLRRSPTSCATPTPVGCSCMGSAATSAPASRPRRRCGRVRRNSAWPSTMPMPGCAWRTCGAGCCRSMTR